MQRYALYFAPERGSALDVFGNHWLGRCAETGAVFEQPPLPGFSAEELRRHTRAPGHYGFHGTLVPPFEPKPGVTGHHLIEHAELFAKTRPPFDMGPLSVREVGSFIALVPAAGDGLAQLAEAALRTFHPFRESPSLAELERRRARGLTPVQERLLANWGYPYVLEEFRFHLTLTGSIPNKTVRETLARRLADHAAAIAAGDHPVHEVCLFRQENGASPFTLVHRAKLGA